MYPTNSYINMRNIQVSNFRGNIGSSMYTIPPPSHPYGTIGIVTETHTLQQLQMIRLHNFSGVPLIQLPHQQQHQKPQSDANMMYNFPNNNAPLTPFLTYKSPSPLEQMRFSNFMYMSNISTSSTSDLGSVTQPPSITSAYSFKFTNIVEDKPFVMLASPTIENPSNNKMPPGVISMESSDGVMGPEHQMSQLDNLKEVALLGCTLAEALASCHHKRPCFKKIDSICARLKQDLEKVDNVVSNINSQGLAWAVKDFIFVFTRIMNAWIIIKGYVNPEGLAAIQSELCPNFVQSFHVWHKATHVLVVSLIQSFMNLNKIAKSQRGSGHLFTKPETMGQAKEGVNVGQTTDEPGNDFGEPNNFPLYDGAYIPTGVYPSYTHVPPGFEPKHKPVVSQKDSATFVDDAGSKPMPNERSSIPNNNNLGRRQMDQLHSKASTDCISWVLEKVSAIDEAQYFYSVNFAKNYFPDFHLVADEKCDLRTIYRKNEVGHYSMLYELLDDLQRIIDVCKVYLETPQAYNLWPPGRIIVDHCTPTQRKELENYPKMEMFISKMEKILRDARNDETIMSCSKSDF